MAFKMNRPVIKGTASHKASIAKAKSEQGANTSLIEAGIELGKSYIPKAIDYSTDKKEQDYSDAREAYREKLANKNPKSSATEDVITEEEVVEETTPDAAEWEKERLAAENAVAAKRKAEQMAKKPGQYLDPKKIEVTEFGGHQTRQYTKKQRDRLKTEGVWSETQGKMVLPEELVDNKFISKAKGVELDIIETNPIIKRDDKIWNGAIKDGKVHKNMRKSGYMPQNER